MKALRFSLKKEWLEAIRTKKLLVLAIVAMFFSLLDPVMLKLTPYLLEEFAGIDVGNAIALTHEAQLISFNQDIYQIFSIVLVIIVGNTWLNELKNETLIMPISKGVKLSSVMLGKIFIYALFINGLLLIAYTINYAYSGLIFGFNVGYNHVLYAGTLMGLYYSFTIVFMITLSPIIASYPGVILTTLLVIYGGPFLATLFRIETFTPFGMLSQSMAYQGYVSSEIFISIASGLILSIGLYIIGITVASKKEIVKYK